MSLGEAGENGGSLAALCAPTTPSPGEETLEFTEPGAKTGSKAQISSSHQAWPGETVTQTQLAAGNYPCQDPEPLGRGVRAGLAGTEGRSRETCWDFTVTAVQSQTPFFIIFFFSSERYLML